MAKSHVEQNKFGKWRVYRWGQRADHALRVADDKQAWLLDSEHEKKADADKRAAEITKEK